jgi:tetratricopeptide (TPR) repeat protein
MSRIVRERGQVGRRIWRRRMRKRGSGEHADDGVHHDGPPPEGALPIVDVPVSEPSGTRAKPGLFARLRDKLFGDDKDSEPAYLATDPVGDVLAVPRGAARLDAFERALLTAQPGAAMHKDLALAYHRELAALAEGAGVDLSLLEARVEACAQALIAAGEEERAGSLFLRMGRRHQAVEMFVKAGAVDELEEAYAEIHWDEGGPKLDARLAFERFEALFVVGMRDAALLSLERAVKLWGDNPVFVEVHSTFVKRLGVPHRLTLKSARAELSLVSKWPVVLGRGEEAAVRLESPLLSRAHVQIALAAGVPTLSDLEGRGGTRLDGGEIAGARAFAQAPGATGSVDMGGVLVHYARHADALALWPALAAERRTWAVIGPSVTVPATDWTATAGTLKIDARGRAVALKGTVVNGEAVRRDMLLLEGDRLGAWTVATR